MISIVLKNGSKRSFNLKNFERERKLEAAWHTFSGDEKYEKKRFRITTDTGERLDILVGDIQECKFKEAVYARTETVGNIKDKQQQKSPADRIREALKQTEDERIDKFLKYLNIQGIPVNMNDPELLEILRHVKNSEDWKIPMYANLYKASRKR